MDALHNNSSRTWKQWLRQEFKAAVILVMITTSGFLLLTWLITPSDVNHFVIINQSGRDIEKLNVTLRMNEDRTQAIYDSVCPNRMVRVINWQSAFGRNWWVEVAADGVDRNRVELQSHGRYYHAMVVLLDGQGKVHVESDKLPHPRD